jgi:nucleoside-diphosphate-sugar epimerase
MIVLVAGADGRLGGHLVPRLLARGDDVRALVRTDARVAELEAIGAEPVVVDLRGDVEWAVDGCDAAIFAAGTHHRVELGAVDAGGATKLAEAADRFDLRQFVLCSAIGAEEPERHRSPLREFLAAKRSAERHLEGLEVPWTILRFGRLTDAPRTGRIGTAVDAGDPIAVGREDAAETIVEALRRPNLTRRVVEVIAGERHIADALDAVEPAPLPHLRNHGLGAAQALNPSIDPEMLFSDAEPLDTTVDYEGEGPEDPEILDNEDPAPGIP